MSKEFFLNEQQIALLRRNDGDDVPQHDQLSDQSFVE
jgi:hypothetical protein